VPALAVWADTAFGCLPLSPLCSVEHSSPLSSLLSRESRERRHHIPAKHTYKKGGSRSRESRGGGGRTRSRSSGGESSDRCAEERRAAGSITVRRRVRSGSSDEQSDPPWSHFVFVLCILHRHPRTHSRERTKCVGELSTCLDLSLCHPGATEIQHSYRGYRGVGCCT
jgi:hypothetical protein